MVPGQGEICPRSPCSRARREYGRTARCGRQVWQAFAIRNEIALIGCHFTDKAHEEPFIENYANASQGSGQVLLDALIAFSRRSDHPELVNAPLLLWGFSAGGEFNYEFTAWKPERVAAFVVNKGGIYFSALLPAARRVPGLLFVGEQDLESRKRIISGLFALNRRAGALWAFAEEPNVGHVVGRSQEMAAIFSTRHWHCASARPRTPHLMRH
jgi:hypothetical protein